MTARTAADAAVVTHDQPADAFPDQRERQWRSRPRRSSRSMASVSCEVELPSELLLHVWTGADVPTATGATLSTGIEALNAQLPGGGWPHRALTEILTAQPSVLEWRLLAPALRVVAAQGRPIVLIAPPKTPHLPGLEQEGIDDRQVVWIRADPPAQRLWCTEQILKTSDCGAVVTWLAGARPEHLRRLQVFANNFNAPAFVLRGIQARHETSAAPLRLIVEPGTDWALKASVFKRRGPVHDDELSFAAIPRSLDPVLTPRLRRPSGLSHRPNQEPAPAHAMGSTPRSATRLDPTAA